MYFNHTQFLDGWKFLRMFTICLVTLCGCYTVMISLTHCFSRGDNNVFQFIKHIWINYWKTLHCCGLLLLYLFDKMWYSDTWFYIKDRTSLPGGELGGSSFQQKHVTCMGKGVKIFQPISGPKLCCYDFIGWLKVFTVCAQETEWHCWLCYPILIMTFPEWLSGTEPWLCTPGAMGPSSSCFCMHMYSFAGLIRRMPQPTFSDTTITYHHSDTTIFQLRAH